ncbi:MAG TPA: hypothetical protein DCG48_12340 [Rhodospirillaceae bacterium]|nr:hypothetical protein [Rhodospirillaceae bacterium]|tara:strand:+ start:28793 stop:29335 length:543 start_codon:yes stop_codon:yes gene_type:complete
MPKYSIDISREGDNWVAVVPELLAVGRGKDPASAVDDALEKARTTEKALLDSNLADHDRAGHLRVRIRQSRLLAVAGEAFVDFGIRAAIVGAILIVLYVLVANDVKSITREIAGDFMAQVSLLRNSIEGTGRADDNVPERLRARSERVREILTPAAQELRPLFRILMSDNPDPADAAAGK